MTYSYGRTAIKARRAIPEPVSPAPEKTAPAELVMEFRGAVCCNAPIVDARTIQIRRTADSIRTSGRGCANKNQKACPLCGELMLRRSSQCWKCYRDAEDSRLARSREKALALKAEGLSLAQIAQALNVHRNTVARWARAGTAKRQRSARTRKPGYGPDRMPREERQVIVQALRMQGLSSIQIGDWLGISHATVSRDLQ